MFTKILGWAGKGAAAVAGGLVALAVVVALVTQSVPTGLKASLTLTHYGVVMVGGLLSYADNLGPDLAAGKKAGDKALPTTTTKPKATP